MGIIAGYVRVSTEMQAERDSIVSQEESIISFAQRKNKSYRIYKDIGISAKDKERPAFKEMIEDIKKGEIEAVVVTKLDRITRSLKDLIYLKELFDEYNVSFIALTQNLDTSTPMGRFSFYVLGLVAQLEREVTAERVAEVMKSRARKKKWNGGVVPFGFNRVLDKNKLIINEDEAEVVRKIFELYLKYKSFRKVTHRINVLGFRTRKGNPWAPTSIKRILQNPIYFGALTYNKRQTKGKTSKPRPREEHIIVEGVFKPIISKEIFSKVQKIIKKQREIPSKAKSSSYLLTGLVRCGLCNSRMYGYIYNNKRRGKVYQYYRCSGYLQKGKAFCPGNSVDLKYLEEVIIKELKNFKLNPGKLKDKVKDYNLKYKEEAGSLIKRKREIQGRLTKLERKISRLFSLYEDELIEKEEFIQRREFLKEERKILKKEMEEIEEKLVSLDLETLDLNGTLENIKNLASLYEELDFQEKKELLRTVISDIVIGEDWIDYSIYGLNRFFVNYNRMDAHAATTRIPIRSAPAHLRRSKGIYRGYPAPYWTESTST